MKKKRPVGWEKTIMDLMDEIGRGERLTMSGDEIEWAREYERSLLPLDTVFPRCGEVWEALDDCEVSVDYVFAAQAGFGGKSILPRGERIRIESAGVNPEPIVVAFTPVRYEALQDHFVPENVRAIPRYTNYGLSARTAYFNAHFKLIEKA